MARDIEEFLRRAAERRQQQKNQGGQPAQQKPQQPPAQRQPPRKPLPPIEEVEVEIIEPTLVSKSTRASMNDSPITRQRLQSEIRNESVSEHVSRHIDTARISEHAQSLGDRITSVHDQVEAEVHKHLDHDITVIDDKPTITDDPRQGVVGATASKMAGELLQMLSHPKTIRQAILMSEILNRPNFDDE